MVMVVVDEDNNKWHPLLLNCNIAIFSLSKYLAPRTSKGEGFGSPLAGYLQTQGSHHEGPRDDPPFYVGHF